MKTYSLFIPLFILTLFISPLELKAQWPQQIKLKSGGVVSIYQPQYETLNGNVLTGRAAFSGQEKTTDELTFGMFWFDAIIDTDRDTRVVTLESIKIKDMRLPGIEDTSKINSLKRLLETEIPKWDIKTTIDEITTSLEQENKNSAVDLKNDAPIITYTDQLSTLVLFDGEPKLQDDKQLSMKRVVNTAFLLVQNPDDTKYYLYGGQYWYSSSTIKDGYKPLTKLPTKISALDKQLQEDQKKTDTTGMAKTKTAPVIIMNTVPTELIQSDGVAAYANITGTNILYVTNSSEDIFKNIMDQKYYVLLSGRWYASLKLEGPWTYIAADKLPQDFQKIPAGSEKDNVLASVSGTQASKDAVMDAQVPQTAKVDRKTATCTIKYDGDPKFEKIEGTSMDLAMNTSSTVMKSGAKFYCVETGIWFVSDNATGPWAVSDSRPADVDKIPASSPAYNTTYVYVYSSTPEVVYVGYTPGYTGCYVYGPTVVYGTGYYYNPWYGPYYYPRPVTYGFCMHYNPYMGWGVSFHYSSGCFVYSSYHHGGYWGPPMYRPHYHAPYHGGMYGPHGPKYVNRSVNVNVNHTNNIYNNNKGAKTKDINRSQAKPANRPSTMDQKNTGQRNQTQNRAANQPAKDRQPNNVYANKDGSVMQRNDNGNVTQRDGNQWKGSQQNNANTNNAAQNRERSAQQNNNFNQNRSNSGGFGSGGGARTGGGGGRGRR